jgi:lambda repressor-like predicted transcriptional regulator
MTKPNAHTWGARGDASATSKLTADQVAQIKRALLDGVSMKELAAQYGVSYGTIANIRYGRTWFDVKAAADDR